MSYTQEFEFTIEQYFGGLSGSGYSLGPTSFVVSKTFVSNEPFQAQTLPYVGGLMVGSMGSLALALPETMTSISGVQQKMSLDCPAPQKLNSAYDNWKSYPNVQFVEHGMGLALYICVDDDHADGATWQSTGCYYPEIVWTGSYAATLKFYYDRRPCTVSLYTVKEWAVVDDADSGTGHVEYDMGTKKPFGSETVKSGTSLALPGADEMQEAVGGDVRILTSSSRVWKKSLDSSGGVFVASPLTVYGDMELYCCYTPSDGSKLAKFGTLKKMFGVYKQKSDAALDARLANLPSGGVDTEAVNSAIDAKLAIYTTERNTYVTNAIANAGYATDADVAQAVEEGTSGLATTASVMGAVDAAKTELRAEMPKAYDFVSNSEREDAGYLTAKNLYEDNFVTGMDASDMINLALRRPSATSTNTWGFLGVKKSDIEAVANAAIETKMSEVRDAVNGVVLYENTSHDHDKLFFSLKGNLFDTYERIEVTARAHRDITSNVQIVTAISTFTAAELAMGTGTGARPITHMVGYVWDASNFDEFLLGVIQVYTFLGNNPQTDVYVEDNIRNFRVAADGTNATATIKPAGTYWVHLERVVGYKKLPEVS